MDNLNKLVQILQEIKLSGNLSETDHKKIDEALELTKKKQKKDVRRSIVLAAKFIYDYFLKDS